MKLGVRSMERVLLVEDNPADRRLAFEAFRLSLPNIELHSVEDGEEALRFLYGKGQYEESPLPDLILLDLNLPKKTGRQVLAEIKNDSLLKQIPIVVLTSSQADEDVHQCYSLHANCYVTKPVDLDEYFSVIRDIEQFWLISARLPKVDTLGYRYQQRLQGSLRTA